MKENQDDAALENELITNFLDQFFMNFGYYPVVISKYYRKKVAKPIITLDDLKEAFTDFLPHHHGKIQDLESNLRIRPLVTLRFIYVYIARQMGYRLADIGKSLNNRDHSTILYNLKAFRDLYETDENFRNLYFQIIKLINQRNESSDVEHPDQMECQS